MSILCICLTTSDWINIASIVVNASIAVYIVRVIQKKGEEDKSRKELLTAELNDIREDYFAFFNNLIYRKISFETALDWFKVMGIRISIFESLMIDLAKEKKSNKLNYLTDLHVEIKRAVTKDDLFNKTSKKDSVEISRSIIEEIQTNYYKLIRTHFLETIVSINSPKSSRLRKRLFVPLKVWGSFSLLKTFKKLFNK